MSSSTYRYSALLRSARSDVSQLNEHNRALEYTIAFYLYPATVSGRSNTVPIAIGNQHDLSRLVGRRKPWTLCVMLMRSINLKFYSFLRTFFIAAKTEKNDKIFFSQSNLHFGFSRVIYKFLLRPSEHKLAEG